MKPDAHKTLGELLRGLPHEKLGSPQRVTVQGVRYDSREVGAGDVFVAIRGYKTDGHDYIAEAVARGAAVVVGDRRGPLKKLAAGAGDRVCVVFTPDARLALAHLGSRFFGEPGKKLQVVAVTGTNGKTSTTYMLHHCLHAISQRSALFGTIVNRIGDDVLSVRHTTPESLDLQGLLARCVEKKIRYVAMEVSSHALELKRVAGVPFHAGVFTNLTQDHLDFHGTLAHYFAAKRLLFSEFLKPSGRPGVINLDCPWGQRLVRLMGPLAITFGSHPRADYRLLNAQPSRQGMTFSFAHAGKTHTVALPVLALFHAQNALAALAVLHSVLGVAMARAIGFFADFQGVPGRFAPVVAGQDFWVVVDYAHTPAGVENVLCSARAMNPRRLIVLLGCGGDRDKTKRPLMGKVAEELADHVVLTSDNPRSEDPRAILKDIEAGMTQKRRRTVVADRQEAIAAAINMAKPGDMVVLAGKGHETEQIFRDRTVHFDDAEVARRLLRASR